MTSPLYNQVDRYLRATGWLPPAEIGEIGGLWRHPTSEYLLPIPKDLTPGGVDWQVIVERLASFEQSKAVDVAARLEGQAVDIATLRAANDIVIRDTIPYAAGLVLVQSSWTMLRSSATTALGQRAWIRRYSKTGDDVVSRARMAHTRKGSFIIPILLPISDPESEREGPDEPQITDMALAAGPEPMERRVMRTFAEALATLDNVAVRPEREPNASSDAELVRSGVSHQFVQALHKVLTEQSVDEFSANFEWTPLGGPAPRGTREVTIPAAASERIGAVAQRLRSRTAPRVEEQFVGPIRGVERDHDADTGSVTVEIARNGRPINVSVNVSADVLDQAWQWARDRKTVVVNSKVHTTRTGLQAATRDAVTPLMVDITPT